MNPRPFLFAALLLTMCNAAPKEAPLEPLELANREWRILGKPEAAIARLKQLPPSVDVHLELARIAAQRKDWSGARAEAEAALTVAKTGRERRRATVAGARYVIEARDLAQMPAAIAALREVIAVEGPILDPSRLLARAGLLAGNGAAALEGVNGYYHVSEFSGPPHLIAPSHAVLARVLPAWEGTKSDELASALAGVRFFEEAALVATSRDLIDYAAALRRIEDGVNEYYRRMANDDEKERDVRTLGKLEPRIAAIGERYGVYVNVGKTASHVDMHMAHRVTDSQLNVEQYGRKATVRFIVLDGVVSNGYSQWLADGKSGDGGWGTAKEIYQVRPLYANGPLRDWLRVTDAELRAEDEKKTELPARLRRQYLAGVLAELCGRGLEGTALRDAFLSRVERDRFQHSIVLHEGRHAIDDASGEGFKVWELEYRAKLAQLALSDAPRDALESIVGDTSGGPHGKARERLMKELHEWMRANAPSAKDLDDLSDAQIRAAGRSLDPLAR